MDIQVIKTQLEDVTSFRTLFLHEGHFQFTYDKCHYYGWADTYVFFAEGKKVGYGAVWGKENRVDRDSIMEFFVLKTFRQFSSSLFLEFISASGASFIECQSNDFLLRDMLYQYGEKISAEAILFEDNVQTNFLIPGATFGRRDTGDKNKDDVGGFFIEQNEAIVATGGFMLNYNIPYADIYMEVKDQSRRKGFGSLLIQELKREIYLMGRVPAARCNIHNAASKATLLKAGFKICGFRLAGTIKHSPNREKSGL